MKFKSGELAELPLKVELNERPRGAGKIELDLALLVVDLVGSEAMLRGLGDLGYASFLDDYKDVAHGCFGVDGGHEVADTGDGFIFAFATVDAAVRAATCFNDRVATIEIVGTEAPAQVRAGVHYGPLVISSYGIVGLALYQTVEMGNAAPAEHLWLSDRAQAEVSISTMIGERVPVVLPRTGPAWVIDVDLSRPRAGASVGLSAA